MGHGRTRFVRHASAPDEDTPDRKPGGDEAARSGGVGLTKGGLKLRYEVGRSSEDRLRDNKTSVGACGARWDFVVRYLDRDLPPLVYEETTIGELGK